MAIQITCFSPRLQLWIALLHLICLRLVGAEDVAKKSAESGGRVQLQFLAGGHSSSVKAVPQHYHKKQDNVRSQEKSGLHSLHKLLQSSFSLSLHSLETLSTVAAQLEGEKKVGRTSRGMVMRLVATTDVLWTCLAQKLGILLHACLARRTSQPGIVMALRASISGIHQ